MCDFMICESCLLLGVQTVVKNVIHYVYSCESAMLVVSLLVENYYKAIVIIMTITILYCVMQVQWWRRVCPRSHVQEI